MKPENLLIANRSDSCREELTVNSCPSLFVVIQLIRKTLKDAVIQMCLPSFS